jgi:hypothetical protein
MNHSEAAQVDGIVRHSWLASTGHAQSGVPLNMLVTGSVENSIQGSIEGRVWLHCHPAFLEESLDGIEESLTLVVLI